MSNWALIIGINNYDEANYKLGGAVNDAAAFLKWCRDPAGGAVPPENINLLLDPQDTVPPDLIAGTQTSPQATRTAASKAISNLLQRSNSVGERFFFYFAGHGLTARSNGADIPCICLRDFAPDVTTNSISLSSIFERFHASRFQEQYFFIDACRNVPFYTEFQVSDFDRPVAATAPPFPQFIAYATQPRNTAQELIQPGYEGGAFTQVLIDALKGRAAAKQWDAVNGKYLVRWNSLFAYVSGAVTRMNLAATAGATRGLIQSPRQFGERGPENPVLGEFPESDFRPERLEVDFNPRPATHEVSLVVAETGVMPEVYPAPLSAVPWVKDLPPRIYSVVAKSQTYQTRRRMELVELYDTLPVTIDLVAIPPPPPTTISRGITEETPPPSGPGGRHIDFFPAGGVPRDQTAPTRRGGPTGLALPEAPKLDPRPRAITSPDPLVQLEIGHESGLLMGAGRGTVTLPSDRAPGYYRARMITPEGETLETLVELAAEGEGDPVILTPQELLKSQDLLTPQAFLTPNDPLTPGARWAAAAAGMPTHDGLIMPSEAIGSAAFVRLSTLLALAAGAWAEGTHGTPGNRLRQIPIPPLTLAPQIDDTTGGIQVLLGDELLQLNWNTTRLTVTPLEGGPTQPVPVRPSPTQPSIAAAELPLATGAWWLEIHAPNVASFKLPLTVLPNRISLITLTQKPDSGIDLHQYSLLVTPPGFAVPDALLDPQFREARFAALRRVELMQRTYARGRTSASRPDVQGLLQEGWSDPIAGCLGGYLLSRLGRAEELAPLAANLRQRFPGAPDAWVLGALYSNATAKETEAAAATVQALDLGIPTFAQGIRLLDTLAQRWAPHHRRTPQVKQLAEVTHPGSLFSTFSSTV